MRHNILFLGVTDPRNPSRSKLQKVDLSGSRILGISSAANSSWVLPAKTQDESGSPEPGPSEDDDLRIFRKASRDACLPLRMIRQLGLGHRQRALAVGEGGHGKTLYSKKETS